VAHRLATRGRRAANLLAAGVVEGSLSALEVIPEEQRDLDWSFLRAEALTADRRGGEALEQLAARPPTPYDRLPELWRLRSAAALESATVRPGRSNETLETRQERRETAWRDLWQLAMKGDDESRRRALGQLYVLADPEENLELALDVLHRLRALDPSDVTGYRDLWKLGWRDFVRDDMTAAIGVWRELQDLYPETSTARQALYWSGVAHAELGNHSRSTDILTAVLATDTIDFYSRHAARRLGVAARREAKTALDSWPDDPLLARAALLSELGLDRMAATELELTREHSDEQAADGLEALILARLGERRESIQAVWRAFRVLGKPGQSTVPELVRQLYYPLDYEEIIRRWAADRGLPPFLVYGIIRQESAFDAAAVSRAGARGLMQLMPSTGRELAGKLRLPYSTARLSEPDYSVRLGTKYFAQVLEMFDGDVELALAGYNGGPYRMKRWWREAGANATVDRFVEGLSLPETTAYVKRILIIEDSYRQLYEDHG
jgi:soluble lytic murein transglycosylase